MTHWLLFAACLAVAAYQLWRVPRVWAFLLLFIALMPKVAIAAVPGNTTPIRIDDLVVGAALVLWFFGIRLKPPFDVARGGPEALEGPHVRRMCRRERDSRRDL